MVVTMVENIIFTRTPTIITVMPHRTTTKASSSSIVVMPFICHFLHIRSIWGEIELGLGGWLLLRLTRVEANVDSLDEGVARFSSKGVFEEQGTRET